jgi:hypothetical protein
MIGRLLTFIQEVPGPTQKVLAIDNASTTILVYGYIKVHSVIEHEYQIGTQLMTAIGEALFPVLPSLLFPKHARRS